MKRFFTVVNNFRYFTSPRHKTNTGERVEALKFFWLPSGSYEFDECITKLNMIIRTPNFRLFYHNKIIHVDKMSTVETVLPKKRSPLLLQQQSCISSIFSIEISEQLTSLNKEPQHYDKATNLEPLHRIRNSPISTKTDRFYSLGALKWVQKRFENSTR